jgi:hypothetical protein
MFADLQRVQVGELCIAAIFQNQRFAAIADHDPIAISNSTIVHLDGT